eukprot:COSAG06_NODE_2542_length_6702_cov_6.759049_6_plen_80_part_00
MTAAQLAMGESPQDAANNLSTVVLTPVLNCVKLSKHLLCVCAPVLLFLWRGTQGKRKHSVRDDEETHPFLNSSESSVRV